MQHGHVILRRHTKNQKAVFRRLKLSPPTKEEIPIKVSHLHASDDCSFKRVTHTATLPPRQTQSERDLLLSILITHTHTYFFNLRLPL